jgi:CheY-like chemotaxis protein
MSDLELAEAVAELTAKRIRSDVSKDLEALHEAWRRDLSALRDDLTIKNLLKSTACGLDCPLKDELSELAKTKPANILVVDDQEMVRTMLARLLGSTGLVILTAEGSLEALRILEANSDIDVVVADVSMPKNGYTLLEYIRNQYPTTEVIMTSGFDDNADKASKMGAFGFLAKPFTAGQAILMIEKAVELRRLKLQSSSLRVDQPKGVDSV